MRRGAPAVALLAAVVAACDGGSSLLGPGAPQGVEGQVLLGPLCPVQMEGDPCPDRPYQAWIRVLAGDGGRLTRVRSGEDGQFRVGLEPGRYTLQPESGDPLPRAAEQAVVVTAGRYEEVTIRFDTGIR